MNDRPIGVLDSGVGGLTVVHEIQKQLPQESILYVGDTARVPYGGKDPETLLTYGRELIGFLLSRSVKAVIVACGTISSNCFTALREEFPGFPLIDVISPGVQACVDASPKRVGFIATEATVRSGLFARRLREARPDIAVKTRACPLFVPLAEEGWVNNVVTRLVAETYLDDWAGEIDTLVLGCTHYPLLTGALRETLPGTQVIDMAEYTVHALRGQLAAADMFRGESAPPDCALYVTGYTDKFNRMARLALKSDAAAQRIML